MFLEPFLDILSLIIILNKLLPAAIEVLSLSCSLMFFAFGADSIMVKDVCTDHFIKDRNQVQTGPLLSQFSLIGLEIFNFLFHVTELSHDMAIVHASLL
jgi:hypothetical protein